MLAAGSLGTSSASFLAATITRQGNTATSISDLQVGSETFDVEFTGNVTFNAQFGSDLVPATPPLYFGDPAKAQAIAIAVAAVLHADRTLSDVGASGADNDAGGLFPSSAAATTQAGFDIGYEGQGAWGGGSAYSFPRTVPGVFGLVTLANPPTVTLSVNTATIPETGGSATLTATLSEASSQSVTVELGLTGTATNLDDYTITSTQIVIAAGNTTGTVNVSAVHDTLDETDETVIVDITGATNATEAGTQQQTITIADDDDPSADVISTVLNGGQANRSGVASLTMQFTETVTVSGPDALMVQNHTTGAAASLSGASLSGNGTNAITWDLSAVALAPGYYTSTLPKSAGIAATHSELYSVQPGDSDGDGQVGFSDFGELAGNFNVTNGPVYGPGDMDGDRNVGFTDFGILASNFNANLVALAQDTGDAGGTYPAAQHIVGSGLSLGANVGGANDGVTFGTLQAGNNAATITVNATIPSGGSASLNAFVDFNNDGDWNDAGEQIVMDQALSAGANNLTVAIPAGATVGSATARFRLSSIAGYGAGGQAVDGEVEDYTVPIVSALSRSHGRGLPPSALDFWAEAVAAGTAEPGKSSPSFSHVMPVTTGVVDLAIDELSSERHWQERFEPSSSSADLIDRAFEDSESPLLAPSADDA